MTFLTSSACLTSWPPTITTLFSQRAAWYVSYATAAPSRTCIQQKTRHLVEPIVVCSLRRMTRRSVVNLVSFGSRAVSLVYGNSLRHLHTSICNTSSQPKAGFKPEKVAVVTKTTRYEFEQQRYRYAGLSEEDLKQLVRMYFTRRHTCDAQEKLTLNILRVTKFSKFLSVFCSLPWRAPATAAYWKDTTSTLTMWNILWRVCGKTRSSTGGLSQSYSSEADWERISFLQLGHCKFV